MHLVFRGAMKLAARADVARSGSGTEDPAERSRVHGPSLTAWRWYQRGVDPARGTRAGAFAQLSVIDPVVAGTRAS
jgi:hypothetical protein